MTVWITRSEPGAGQLARTLEQSGYATLCAPVLATRTLATPTPTGPFDLAVVLSAACAERFADVAQDCARVLAIGPGTAAALQGAGASAEVAVTASSEGILEELGDGASGQRVLVVRGEGGRKILAPGLVRLGASVTEWPVYRREPCSPSINPANIDTIVASSGDGVLQAGRVWFSANGPAKVAVIVPSQRVAELARTAGFVQVSIGRGADAEAVLEVLNNQ